jgi:hypothetical protein
MTEIIDNTVDQLVAGDFSRMTEVITLKSGTSFKRGDVLEIATGKGIKLATAANAKYVLAEDADATGGDVDGLVYTTGEFNTFACNLNSADEAAVKEALHDRSIFLK